MQGEILKFLKLKIIYLSNHSSSGNTFFLSLIDGHKNIINLPGYVNLNFIFEKNINFSNTLEKFKENNPFFFDTSRMNISTENHQGLFYLGENKDEHLFFDEKKFNNYFFSFSKNLEPTKKNILFAIYYAYSKTINREIDPLKYLIIYSYNHENTLSFLKEVNYDHLIVLTRDLIKNYASYKKKVLTKANLRKKNYLDLFDLNYLYNTSKNFFPLIRKKKTFTYLRIEDLHTNPELYMKKFCKLLNINFDLILLKSSFNNKKYNGHSWDHSTNNFKPIYGFNKNYHYRSDKIEMVEKKHIIFISYFFSLNLNYIKKCSLFNHISNFFSLFLLTTNEKKMTNSKDLILKIIKLRIKYVLVFIYMYFNKNYIKKSKL